MTRALAAHAAACLDDLAAQVRATGPQPLDVPRLSLALIDAVVHGLRGAPEHGGERGLPDGVAPHAHGGEVGAGQGHGGLAWWH